MTVKIAKLSLPCMRGKMGDTFFYSTLMTFNAIADRVKLPHEIDAKYSLEELKLGDWIQRKIQDKRISHIVQYLKTQEQHFFNSIIIGIFDGNPSWQDINIKNPEIDEILDDTTIEYFNRTFGILTLTGEESLFAIDGQHRAISIRKAVEKYKDLGKDEISVIFIGHKTTEEGQIRTRRLFSTLNKYAKPVSQSEIIALSEDNNCSIITRELIDHYALFKNKILINKNRSISIENTTAYTNIMVLYDLVERILTNKNIYGIPVSGHDKDNYITNRVEDEQIKSDYKKCEKYFTDILTNIPSISNFFETGNVNRKEKNTSLFFRPIGQNILFDVYKVALEHKKGKEAISFFAKDNFNLSNKNWKKVFLDKETGNISTEKVKQRYATLLILEALGISINRTKKDIEIYHNFNIKITDIKN